MFLLSKLPSAFFTGLHVKVKVDRKQLVQFLFHTNGSRRTHFAQAILPAWQWLQK